MRFVAGAATGAQGWLLAEGLAQAVVAAARRVAPVLSAAVSRGAAVVSACQVRSAAARPAAQVGCGRPDAAAVRRAERAAAAALVAAEVGAQPGAAADPACVAARREVRAPVRPRVGSVSPEVRDAGAAVAPESAVHPARVARVLDSPVPCQVLAQPAVQASCASHPGVLQMQPTFRRRSEWWWQATGVSASSCFSVVGVKKDSAGSCSMQKEWALICRDNGRYAARRLTNVHCTAHSAARHAALKFLVN